MKTQGAAPHFQGRGGAAFGRGYVTAIVFSPIHPPLSTHYTHTIISMNSSTVLSGRPRRLGALAATGALTLLGLLSSAVCAQTSYVVKEIGVLPGFVSGVATSVNDAGDMTGYCSLAVSNFNDMGFVVRKGILSAVGKLPKKGTYSFATFIHPTTGVVVGSADTGDSRPQGLVKKGTAAPVNVFPNNGGNTHALRVDTAGQVYGYFIGGGSTSWQGGVWTPNPKKAGTYTQTIMGGNGIPMAFNANGQATGYTTAAGQSNTATFWTHVAPRPMQVLPSLPEFWSSLGNGLNDLGDVVGDGHPPFSSIPVKWTATPAGYVVNTLPVLPGHNYGSATAINTRGEILGTSYYGTPGTWDVIGPVTLIVWRQGIPYPVQQSLDPVTGAGWNILSMAGLNNVGQIAATGTKNGVTRALLLTPATTPVP